MWFRSYPWLLPVFWCGIHLSGAVGNHNVLWAYYQHVSANDSAGVIVCWNPKQVHHSYQQQMKGLSLLNSITFIGHNHDSNGSVFNEGFAYNFMPGDPVIPKIVGLLENLNSFPEFTPARAHDYQDLSRHTSLRC